MAWPSGVIAAALAWNVLPDSIWKIWWCAGALLMVLPGSGAPDWMELEPIRRGRGRHTWIAHRTLTHWVPAWLALALYSGWHMAEAPAFALALGFSIGALIHLAADLPNSLGVPLFWPTWRISLNLWNSGRGDALLVLATWTAAAAAVDAAWFESHFRHLLAVHVSRWWEKVDMASLMHQTIHWLSRA